MYADLAILGLMLVSADAPIEVSEKEIKQRIIQQSIMQYQSNCPCPYSTDRAGRSCGARSAWSREGGQSPICYESDVS